MTEQGLAVVVLAAGMGTRMKSAHPKVLHPIAGRAMILHVLSTVEALAPALTIVVVGPAMETLTRLVAPVPTVVQQDRLGTGHAVLQAREALAGFAGTVLVLYGDTPLISASTLQDLLARRAAPDRPAIVVLGFRPRDPGAYGRLLVSGTGLEAIIEASDATEAERAIGLCNSGVMAIDGRLAWDLLSRLGNDNARREYYLTDIVGLARADNLRCACVEGSEEELLGVNSRSELAVAESLVQRRLRQAAMEGGATLFDPASVYFAWDTRLGRDVVVQPHVVFEPGVTVGDRVEIRSFCHLAGVSIGDDAIIGPFARLRPGAVLGRAVHIGNFVEVKQSVIEAGAKVNHLSYIGDARVGSGTNIGAGTITCNYDGYGKHLSDIGAGVFIGSNSSLVAPVKIGDGAIVGAGSVITRDVSANGLAVGRGPQSESADGATRFRAKRAKAKS